MVSLVSLYLFEIKSDFTQGHLMVISVADPASLIYIRDTCLVSVNDNFQEGRLFLRPDKS